MIDKKLLAGFRQLAATLEGVDRDAYTAFNKSPLDPVIGLGDVNARVGFFGRDPGRDEVQYQMPFIGAGGQKVRSALYRQLHGSELPDFNASVAVGEQFFWANTVPYKPTGNKAWSMKVKKQFQPLMAELLLTTWHGRDLITLGREAFLWFGIHQPKEVQQRLEAFWAREDRFESFIEVELARANLQRTLRLHPLPHPSPLNATWYKRFPELLTQRLQQLDVRHDNLLIGR
ncbi:MAG TPA: uracil-DNA glycosylase family protein [Gammaproteobacteria bacterium]